MKLIYAIVNNDDSHAVSSALTRNGFQATKLASTGGFLMAGNTTFMICSEDDKVEDAIATIKEHSHKRKQFVPNSANFSTGGYTSFPVEVAVGGATIFVTNIERFEKV
ncbi:MAG: cyclic-di-AMP receptor [Oscillospiraceae bacterium]|nr:cyclic-di-AMP receptor [Oscillospiraceae bacterium]